MGEPVRLPSMVGWWRITPELYGTSASNRTSTSRALRTEGLGERNDDLEERARGDQRRPPIDTSVRGERRVGQLQGEPFFSRAGAKRSGQAQGQRPLDR